MSASLAQLSTAVPKGTLKRLIGRFRPVLVKTSGVFLLVVVRSALEIAHPLLVAHAIGRLAGDAPSLQLLPRAYSDLLLVLLAVVIAKHVFFYISHVAATKLGRRLENVLRTELFRRITALRFTYHDKNRSGKTIARSLRDMEKAQLFFAEVWFGYLEVGLMLIAVFVAVFVTHWSYGLATFAGFGTGIALCIVTGKKVVKIDRGVSDLYDGVTTVVQENVAGARVVRSFGQEPQEVRKFGNKMDGFSGGWRSLERYWSVRMPFVMNAYHASLPLLLLVGAYRISTGAGNITEVMAVLLFCRHVLYRMRPLMRLLIVGQQAVASASRVFEVLDDGDVMPEPEELRTLPEEGGHLQIEGVAFAHEGGLPVLQDVNLDLPAGASFGLLGPTGAGKSSLVQLLPRFYEPTHGVVRLDGIDIRNLDVHELRREVGVVFQEPFLFSGTVRDNLAYGRPGVDDETIVACAKLAAAHEFIETLPKGYETIIGERGVSLSGGQRQRLTIARALVMEPRVLVFDDATASVDAVTEKRLFDGIRAAAAGRTTLVISQRVTSVRWCDRIGVLEDGRISAIGTHDELLEKSALYREIHNHQRLARRAV